MFFFCKQIIFLRSLEVLKGFEGPRGSEDSIRPNFI